MRDEILQQLRFAQSESIQEDSVRPSAFLIFETTQRISINLILRVRFLSCRALSAQHNPFYLLQIKCYWFS